MPLSIYLHIPFCTHRCAYCDFNTYAGVTELIPAYVDAMCREVEIVGRATPPGNEVHTIFFGGGTPSLLSPAQVECILSAIRDAFLVQAMAEVTLEANPGTVNLASLHEMRRAGVNRISMGVQSANGEELRTLERTHDFGDVLGSVSDARRAGFDNLNLDLIYGLPEQNLSTWKTTLRRILDLEPEHISAYCLTLEHGTPFGQWSKRGLMPVPDADAAADMYELAEEELRRAGYEHYEISNWARNGFRCRHNVQYWTGEPYLGFGAGAHGYAAGYRYSNVLAIREYITRLREAVRKSGALKRQPRSATGPSTEDPSMYPRSLATVEHHRQKNEDEMAEFMIMGLRMTREGVSERIFETRFGVALGDVYAKPLSKLTDLGLLETVDPASVGTHQASGTHGRRSDRNFRLTSRGRLLGNRVFLEFVNSGPGEATAFAVPPPGPVVV